MTNRITNLLGIRYPIIQGGMVWCSGWRLASAVSNCGGLGLLGAGSMHPERLEEHIAKMKASTDKPWGVNIPLLYPQMEEIITLILQEGVKIVFTSAGSPEKWTDKLHEYGITVVHVVSSRKFAIKAQEVGCDAIVVEGVEAGGHNGREESTTLTLVPQVVASCSIPIIAAGGIASGEAIAAMMALGAEGVQLGSRFAVSAESSAHPNFKRRVLEAQEGDTVLALRKIAPTRLLKNHFYKCIAEAEARGATSEELTALLGKGRAKQGIFLGNLEEGELEIGQVSAMLKKEEHVEEIFNDLVQSFNSTIGRLSYLKI